MESTLNIQTTGNEMELYKRILFAFLAVFLLVSSYIVAIDRNDFTLMKGWLIAYIVFEFVRGIVKIFYENMANASTSKKYIGYAYSGCGIFWVLFVITGTIFLFNQDATTFLVEYSAYIIFINWLAIAIIVVVNIFMCLAIVCCCGSVEFRRREKDLVSSMEENFPVRPYTDYLSKYNDHSCAVCLEDFYTSDPVTKLECEHVFHQRCCREWVERKNTCPLCRKDVFVI